MILIDDRVGSKELLPIIKGLKVPCDLSRLEYGDASFSGNGPDGTIAVGIERKTIHDMLACIDDSRFVAHQLPGMKMLYHMSFLCIEGLWCCGDGNGYEGTLIQGFNKGASWGPLRTRGNSRVLYSKLHRYLISVALAGVIITYPRDIVQTAIHITELYHYFNKPWNKHTSLIDCQKLAIPVMNGRPSLVRRWAQEIDDIGIVFGQEAQDYFKTPIKLAQAGEQDWLRLKGPGNKSIGITTARKIVAQINGWWRS